MATRTETDSLGPVQVPTERLWGAQTQRSFENFRISTEQMPLSVIHTLALTKKAAALVNVELGILDAKLGAAIAHAADEVMAGSHDAEFPLSVWQTGSGTQTNMNVNEVLANRASELLGGPRGSGRLVHPNDHVNQGQSSNDVFPTAMAIAAASSVVGQVIPAVTDLRDTLRERATTFHDVIKIGRTHLMDAVPLRLGQEIGGWASQLDHGLAHLASALPHLSELAIGGTAVGTGTNTHPEFGARVAEKVRAWTGHEYTSASNKFEALAAHDGLVFAHGALKTIAVSLIKIANDVRWLASGPRAGLGEIAIPENEPGSSIMPGKINPTQSEALLMACTQVLGNDVVVNLAGSSGSFELNVQKPLLVFAFLQSARLLAGGARSFRNHCAAGIQPNHARIQAHLEQSLMLVTALAPHIGYDAAAKIARHAHTHGTTLREAALALDLTSAEDFDRWVRPEAMLSGT